jgi:hypothetical protein
MAAPLILFPRAEIRDLIQELTDTKVLWDNEPLPFMGQINGGAGYWVELSVKATNTKGIDENRVAYDPVNQINGTTQISYRLYTMTVRVTSNNELIYAMDVMDQIRRGLRSLTAQGEFVNMGVAFVDWGASIDLPKPADNRTTTESVMELRVAWQVSADPGDADPNIIEGIGTVVAETPSDLTGITGSLTS